MSGIIAQNSGRHTGLVKAASAGGVWNLILTQTASASATIDFTSGLDSTYDEYVFKFINLHPSAENPNFTFQGNAAGGSGYNETMTTTQFNANHNEDDSYALMGYSEDNDQAQGTAFQRIGKSATDNDEALSGKLIIYSPSDTTFVKHFMSRVQCMNITYSQEEYVAGYFNTTSAIDEIQFKFSSGNIDSGTISLYGIT